MLGRCWRPSFPSWRPFLDPATYPNNSLTSWHAFAGTRDNEAGLHPDDTLECNYWLHVNCSIQTVSPHFAGPTVKRAGHSEAEGLSGSPAVVRPWRAVTTCGIVPCRSLFTAWRNFARKQSSREKRYNSCIEALSR
ncbi:hypothetical protein CDAR_504311 [Caerostris darwini]|uniref:Uncharacterized protein n=1 Tax=Caerostris darwini TaxID=1538125 RepID=A0AAV4S2U7_9ARAC|nr:hypothetical protein CDAR_504311 [Caerostris darwini]